MFPYIEVFGKQIGLYAIAGLIGFFVAAVLACVVVRKRGEDENAAIVFILLSALGGIFGAHLLYGIVSIVGLGSADTSLASADIDSFGGFVRYVKTAFGGAVFYGGLFGGMAVGTLYIKRKKLNKALYADVSAFSVPLFHAFGRIGCFLGGCCYGVPSSFGCVMTKSSAPGANGIRRFPVQLAESLFNFLLFAVIFYMFQKKKLRGRLFFVYLTSYAIGRFLFEFLRGDEYRGFVFGISVSQFLGVLILVAELVCAVSMKIRERKK